MRKSACYPPDTNYITPCRQKIPASQENYASELRQVMIIRLSKVGRTLLRANGRPWARPLYGLSKFYIPLYMYEKLKEEQIIPVDLYAVLSTLPSKKCSYRRSHFLYTLSDKFIVDFSSSSLCFFVITEKGLESIVFDKIFSDRSKMHMGRSYTGAYTIHSRYCYTDYSLEFVGSALARFELSTLPDHEGI